MKHLEKYTDEELADAYVFPSELSQGEQKEADHQFSELRRKYAENMPEEEKIFSRLMNLKYTMDEYANSKPYKEGFTFGNFLHQYLSALNIKELNFSNEISIAPEDLKNLINNKKEPDDKIFIRLELHSGNNIPALVWWRIFEKQKEQQFTTNKTLRKSERKFVKQVNLARV